MTSKLTGCSVTVLALCLWPSPSNAQTPDTPRPDSEDVIIVNGQKLATIPTEAVTATKTSIPLIDVPATVTVINRALIDSQAATDLQDVLRNSSGVNQAGNNFGIGDYLQSRGLSVAYAYDGLYGGAGLGPDSYAPTRSLTNVERVEIVQGSNATIYGAGSAGGLINLIEKKPQFDEAYQIELRAGSYDTYGATVDATGPLSDDVAYRFVGSVYRKDGFRNLSTDRYEAYGSLAYEPADNSRLTLSAAWLADEIQIDSVGYPVRIFNSASTSPGGLSADQVGPENLPNDPGSSQQLTEAQIVQLADSLSAGDGIEPFDLGGASLISPISRPNDGEEFRFKLRWEWEPIDGLHIVPSSQIRNYTSEYVRQTGAYNYVYWERRGVINQPPRAPLVVDGVLYPFAARRQEYRKLEVEETSWDNFLDVSWKNNFAGIENETLLTAYFQDVNANVRRQSLYDADNARSFDNPLPYILDIRNPVFPTGRFEDYDTYLAADYEKDISTRGIGVQNIAYLAPWLITRIGAGWNRIEQEFENAPTEAAPNREPVDQTDDGFVYNLGATVKPLSWASAFVAYGEGRESYSFDGTLNGTSDRPDSESTNFELGVKLQDPTGRFSGGVTYFETARTNLRYNNPDFEDNPDDPNFNIDVPEFFYDGEDETTGVQLDANVQMTDALFFNANATFQDARNRQNPTSSTFDSKQKGVPDTFLSAYGVYEYGGDIGGGTLSATLGYEYQDSRTIASAAFGLPEAVLPSQGVWDAGLVYDHESGWKANLRIRNLTDTQAYSRALFLGGLPTAPRTVEVAVRKSW